MTIAPRDYRQPGRVLKQDLSTLLAASPEAFDCLVWIAKDSIHDEQVTVEQDVVGSIESGERAQSYEEPIPARAHSAGRRAGLRRSLVRSGGNLLHNTYCHHSY